MKPNEDKEEVVQEITDNIEKMMDELTEGQFNWLVYVTDSVDSILLSTLTIEESKELRKKLKDSGESTRILSQQNVDFSHMNEIN